MKGQKLNGYKSGTKKKTLLRQIQNEPFFSSKFNPLSIWADY